MRLHNYIMLIVCGALLLQCSVLYSLFHYQIDPQIEKLEKTLVVKELHSNLEILQRELFHLEHLTQFMTKEPAIQQLLTTPATSSISDLIKKRMLTNDINFTVILNDQHKVIWDEVMDLANEQPYPPQDLVVTLWKSNQNFFDHRSALSLQSGFFNSALGPFMIVSAPINDSKTNRISGILITGKLITHDMVRMLQSLTLTDLTLWPMGERQLRKNQKAIIQQLANSDSDFIVEQNGSLLRGYMALHDVSESPSILISLTQPRVFSHINQVSLWEATGLFVAIQIVLLFLVYLLIRYAILIPIRKLTKKINQSKRDWESNPHDPSTFSELSALNEAITKFINRNQVRTAHEISYAQRESMMLANHYLTRELDEIIRPALAGIEQTETKLSSLPTKEIEWIIVQSRMGQITPDKLAEYGRKMEEINERLCHYQRETRRHLYSLQIKTLRHATALRVQARHTPGRALWSTPLSTLRSKSSIARSESSFNL